MNESKNTALDSSLATINDWVSEEAIEEVINLRDYVTQVVVEFNGIIGDNKTEVALSQALNADVADVIVP